MEENENVYLQDYRRVCESNTMWRIIVIIASHISVIFNNISFLVEQNYCLLVQNIRHRIK